MAVDAAGPAAILAWVAVVVASVPLATAFAALVCTGAQIVAAVIGLVLAASGPSLTAPVVIASAASMWASRSGPFHQQLALNQGGFRRILDPVT
ncbi:hypothetical protein [Micromonospora sp. Llam0]|uniref:hypothetical protein n=1 Tax=Micromonospora sp. Llam0 TaxID=2485143 RepID=UPI0011CDA753|nr:hypothetical protein [Micromonospora sp. Llam0]